MGVVISVVSSRAAVFKICFLSFIFIICGACSSSSLPDPIEPGTQAPFVRMTYVDGVYGSLTSFRGKKVAFLFWAEWCSKSKNAISEFSKLATKHPQTTFIAVNLDEQKNEEKFREYIATHKLPGVKHVFSGNGGDDETAHAFRIYDVPNVVAVDGSGIVRIVSSDVDDLESFF